jgi:tRNA(Ile)-lysidine synthase
MMLSRFLEYIDNQKLFSSDQRILLAVSGGIDSMVMASLFHTAKFDFGIAHCNFTLRGIESDTDSAFVKKFACDLGLDFFEKSFNTRQIALQKKQSIQVTARELRYNWFNELINENSFDFFATAHQFDDQVETFFINLFRGSGVSGLRGILPKNGKCIRPLLFASRDEILGFASKNGVSFREDISNSSDKYLRNKIRHSIIPAMNSVYPDFRKGFMKTFKNLTGIESFLATEIKQRSEELLIKENNQYKIDIKRLQNLDPIPLYLFELLKPFRFNFSTVDDICNSLEGISGKKFFSPTFCLTHNRDYLEIVPLNYSNFSEKENAFLIKENELTINNPVHLSFSKAEIGGEETIIKDSRVAQLDFKKLKFPLILRKWRQGDLFVPFGMKGKKLLSDYFIDEKFTGSDKHRTWLLVSDEDIVWIVGSRIDDRYKITEKSKIALIIRQC